MYNIGSKYYGMFKMLARLIPVDTIVEASGSRW